MRFIFKISFLILFVNPIWSQEDGVTIDWNPIILGSKLELSKKYVLEPSLDSIQIDRLRMYISSIELLENNEIVYATKQKYFLLDLEDPTSLTTELESQVQFDMIRFGLGVDSLTNASGAQSGDLDPINGMYWAWNSGYINFKLEGQSPSCPTRNNKFNYHIGGFLKNQNAYQRVELPVDNGQKIIINLDVGAFLNHLDFSVQHTLMSPGPEAVGMSKLLSHLFNYQR